MNEAPLVEVKLQLQFDSAEISRERMAFLDQTLPEQETIVIGQESLELISIQKASFSGLRDHWSTTLPMILNTAGITSLKSVSLSYLNEIPLQDLRNFQSFLNISIDMPSALKDRIEFFRSEFTYKYEFGEIRVWLQPDWNDPLDTYCIQLHLESRASGPVMIDDLFPVIERMHNGLKDVFHQVLADDYIRRLPQ
jgi:uncharacterized protein (TIGR04255 family)